MLNEVKFDFDTDAFIKIEELVKYAGDVYILTEANESTATSFRNAAIKGMTFSIQEDGSRKGKLEGVGDSQSVLLSGCLFYAEKNGEGYTYKTDKKTKRKINVPIEIIKTWPAKVVKPLFDRAKEISKLNEEETKTQQVNTTTMHTDSTDVDDQNGDNGSTMPNDPSPKDPVPSMQSSP